MKQSAKHNLLWALLGFGITLLLPVTSAAQLTNTSEASDGQKGAPQILKHSARTAAMADATVADPNDLSVVNINPAGLAFVRNTKMGQINVSQNWNTNLLLENFTLPAIRFSNHTFAAQFGIHHDRGLQNINPLGINPFPSPKLTMYQMDLVYAFSVAEVLSFGVLGNISHAQNQISKIWTFYPTLGVLYTPSESLSYGLAFRGLGKSVMYAIKDPSQTFLWSQELPEILEIGARLKFPIDETEYTDVSISLSNEKKFNEDGSWYKMGIEVKSFPFIALRSGMLLYPEEDIYAPRFGIGIVSDIVELDYAVSYHEELFERFHQLGITLHFDKF